MLQGQQYDWETGLFYNRHRYLDPLMRRYLTQDPIELAGGLNFYAYVGNPVQFVDPLGLKPGDVFGTPDAAAVDAGDYSRANCRDGFECGGWISPKGGGYTYNYIQAKKRPDSVSNEELQACKPLKPAAAWHKHPWYKDSPRPSDDTEINQFSGVPGGNKGDIPWAEQNKMPLYLIAPSGTNKVYEPGRGERVLP